MILSTLRAKIGYKSVKQAIMLSVYHMFTTMYLIRLGAMDVIMAITPPPPPGVDS
jgi:hypothetical protein